MLEKLKNKTYKLLRWSEKYTKTDMVYLATGGFWLILGQILSSASSFLLAIAFANLLPKETYGNYKYILSLVGMLSILTLPGINTAVVRSIAKGYEGSFFPALKTKIKWGAIGSLAGLSVAIYYFIVPQYELAISMLIVSAFIPFTEGLVLYQSFLNGRKMVKILTKYITSVKIVSLIALVVSIYISDNLYIILIAFFLPITLMRLFFILKIKNNFSLNNKTDGNTVKYGKSLSWINVISIIGGQIDKVLIFNYLGAMELAVYSLAIAPLEQIKSLFKNITVLTLPKFSEQSVKNINKKAILSKIAKLSILIILITIIYIILAPFVFKIVFPKYPEAVFYSQIFSISLISISLFIIISFFESQKMTKEIYTFNILSNIIMIATLFIFVFYFGLLGAIIARVISRFINLFISIFLFKKSN